MAKTDFDELMSIGIDIGKDTFHLVGLDQAGQRVLRKQIKRLAMLFSSRTGGAGLTPFYGTTH